MLNSGMGINIPYLEMAEDCNINIAKACPEKRRYVPL